MRRRKLILVLALLLLTPALAKVTSTKIKSTANWAIVDADGINAPVSMDADKDGICFRYKRNRPTRFRYTLPLKDFQKLEIEVKSNRAMSLELRLTDESGAHFHYEMPLEENDWSQLTVTPADLIPDTDKNPLNPAGVMNELYLADTAGKTGEKGSNTLTIRKVRIETPGD